MATRRGAVMIRPSAQAQRKFLRMRTASLTPYLRREISVATSTAVPALRAAIRSIPSEQSYRSHGLRSDLAKGVKRIIKRTPRSVVVAITVSGTGRAPLANLARAVEGLIPWRHPVFGNKGYVTQSPRPFFFKTLDTVKPKVKLAFRKALIIYEQRLR